MEKQKKLVETNEKQQEEKKEDETKQKLELLSNNIEVINISKMSFEGYTDKLGNKIVTRVIFRSDEHDLGELYSMKISKYENIISETELGLFSERKKKIGEHMNNIDFKIAEISRKLKKGSVKLQVRVYRYIDRNKDYVYNIIYLRDFYSADII